MKLTLLSLSALIISCSFGQTVTMTNASYLSLSGETSISNGAYWESVSDLTAAQTPLALGFSFKAFGTSFDSLYFGEGAVQGMVGNADLYLGLAQAMIDRGYPGPTGLSDVSYKRIGTSPNRIVQFQWKNFGFYGDVDDDSVSTSYGNVQLWVYESNKAELRFGASNITDFLIDCPFGANVWAFISKNGVDQGKQLSGNGNSPTVVDINTVGFMYSFPQAGKMVTMDFAQTNSTTIPVSVAKPVVSAQGILFSGIAPKTVLVYSMDGRQIAEIATINNNASLLDLSTGIYIATWENAGKMETMKFLKNDQ